MSIFVKNLKTLETNITGNKLRLRFNVAVWLILEQEFGIKQGDWAEHYQKESTLTLAKFLTSLLKANKYDISLEEVVENVTEGELERFIQDFHIMNLEDIADNMNIKEENEGK